MKTLPGKDSDGLACWVKERNYFAGSKKHINLPASQKLKIIIMNKADLIEKIAADTGITKTQANAALDSFTEAVTKSLKKGDKVTLVGFGTFLISKHKARMGRNPKTKQPIKIKARNVARFKAGKELAAKL